MYLFLALFISFSAIATDHCGADQSCLVHLDYGNSIKFETWEDERTGSNWNRLSSNSYLSDTVYVGAKLCFTGEEKDICEILSTLASIESDAFYGGGHSFIKSFSCSPGTKLVKIDFTVSYDMSPRDENISASIKRCSHPLE
jgi:hypothetical protein